MADPLEEALAGAVRGISALDQQLAACRDANGRLTADRLQLEIRLKRLQEEYEALADEYRRMREKADQYADILMEQRDLIVARDHRIAELAADLAVANVRADELEGELTRWRS